MFLRRSSARFDADIRREKNSKGQTKDQIDQEKKINKIKEEKLQKGTKEKTFDK